MARRFHTPTLRSGQVALDAVQSRHARDVLRLVVGTTIELFDDAGRSAGGTIVSVDDAVIVRVDRVNEPSTDRLRLIVAAAVPKGNRADWMIEKLAEIGVDVFIPLAAERSVVLPAGSGKLARWQRISQEASKQSKRIGVMVIEPLTPVTDVLKRLNSEPAWCLATEAGSVPVAVALNGLSTSARQSLTLFIGPEGGWTSAELAAFVADGVSLVRMTDSILRIETAAVAAAVIVTSLGRFPSRTMPIQ